MLMYISASTNVKLTLKKILLLLLLLPTKFSLNAAKHLFHRQALMTTAQSDQ